MCQEEVLLFVIFIYLIFFFIVIYLNEDEIDNISGFENRGSYKSTSMWLALFKTKKSGFLSTLFVCPKRLL